MTLSKLLWTIFILYSLYVWWSFFAGRMHCLSNLGFDIEAVERWKNPCA